MIKKIAFLILVLFILGCETSTPEKAVQPTCNKPYLLVGVECCLDKDDNSICDKDEVTEEVKAEPVAETKEVAETLKVIEEVEVPTELKLKLGETAKTDTLQVSVLSAEQTKSYGYSIGTYATSDIAKTGNTFIIIDIKIENIGADSKSAGSYYFSMSDSEGYRYENGYYAGDDSLDFMELYKNQKMKGKMLFEVPKTATGLKLHYEFGDLFTTKLATWDIE